MSGCFGCVLFADEIGNALVAKSDEPQRHGQLAALATASEVKGENATFAVNFWQITNERDDSFCVVEHDASPRSKPERFGSVVEASFRLNELTGVIDGTAVCPRPTAGTKSRFGTVANDAWHPLGAA